MFSESRLKITRGNNKTKLCLRFSESTRKAQAGLFAIRRSKQYQRRNLLTPFKIIAWVGEARVRDGEDDCAWGRCDVVCIYLGASRLVLLFLDARTLYRSLHLSWGKPVGTVVFETPARFTVVCIS